MFIFKPSAARALARRAPSWLIVLPAALLSGCYEGGGGQQASSDPQVQLANGQMQEPLQAGARLVEVPAPTPVETQAAVSSPAPQPEYVPTLVNGFTPSPYQWAGRWWRVNAGSTRIANMPHSVQVSPSGSRVRFEVRNTDNDQSASDSSGVRRAEFSGSLYGDPTRLPNGQQLWGAFSFKHHAWGDPQGMANLKGGIYGQIHIGSTFGGSPALAFRRRADGYFRITTRGENDTDGTTRYVRPLSFDEIHDLVYSVVLHPTEGRLKVWLDGTQIVDVSGASIGHSNAESYWNLGVYFAGGITTPVVAEYANHVYPAPGDLGGRVTARPVWPD